MVSSVKGTFDLFYPEIKKYLFMEDSARKIFSLFGFSEIRTPILEHTELFSRSVGDETDIVKKEMYTFLDKKGRSLTLRPENTAPVMRAIIEHKLYESPRHSRLYYIGPQFRYERPQKGRYRQFHQIGIEIINDSSPLIDFEGILIAKELLNSLGILEVEVKINSVGCKNCRPNFIFILKEYLSKFKDDLCTDCDERIERNTLRVLDCKVLSCQKVIENSPAIMDYLCDECREHFSKVTQFLNDFEIPFKVTPRLVRGLDYYTKTVFEMTSFKLGSQDAIVGGGRYDGLIASLGGPDIPSFGWALGMERLSLLMEDTSSNDNLLYVAWIGEDCLKFAMKCASYLRSKGIEVVLEGSSRSLKNSLKRAEKFQASYSLIVGEDEVKSELLTLKNMRNGEQTALKLNEIPDFILDGE
jgi:histidyl-tRNA synthetase